MKSFKWMVLIASGMLLSAWWDNSDTASGWVALANPRAPALSASVFDSPRERFQEPGEKIIERPLSDQQLRLLIQRQQHEMLARLVRNDASQLSGSAGFLAKLELDAEQHRELGRIIGRSNKEAEDILREAVQAAAESTNPEARDEISRDTYRKVAELAENGLDEFKRSLLPHQVEQLDQLLASVRFQAILQISQQYDEPWPRVTGIYLGLTPEETRRFQTAVEQSVANFRNKIERARRELTQELGDSSPPGARAKWMQILGDDPRELAEYLGNSTEPKQ